MKIFVVLLLAASLLSLTGCGKQSNNSTGTPAATNAPPTQSGTNGPAK